MFTTKQNRKKVDREARRVALVEAKEAAAE
jgi:hypothetical protein